MEEKIRELQEQLTRIEAYAKLGAKNVLDLEEVAMLTGLSKWSIYQLTSKKQIPHYKPNGRLVYFDKKEVEDWLRQNRQGTQLEAEQQAVAYTIKKGGTL